MNSTSHALALAACTAALTAVVAAQGQGIDYAKIEILTEQVAPNLYLLSGSAGADPGHQDAAGGRIGVLAGPTTKLVPGHGTIITRSEIVPYRDMIRAVQARVQQLIAQGKSEQDVLAAKVTAPYDAKVPGGLERAGAGTSADRFVSMVYAQLKGTK